MAGNDECLRDLRLTDPRDDKERIENTKGGLLRDSYKWILENHDFQRWRNDNQNQLLWIRGDPGKGKTMLLCGILDELKKLSTANISYFFCQATDSRINTATAVLRGLIYLLVDQQPSLISHIRNRYDQAGKQLFDDANAWVALSAIFKNVLQDPTLRMTYLVIDALDECVTSLEDLQQLIIQMSMANSRVKWIASSRNWPNIEKAFGKAAQDFSLSLELNEMSVAAAVASYIEYSVGVLSRENEYDSSTGNTVGQYLRYNAGGTFLWVALVCQKLAKISAWKVDSKTLSTFPPGLDSLYKRMVDDINKSEDVELCKEVLATLSITYRPITLDELPSLVEIPPRAVGNDKALAEIIETCGSFLSLRHRTIFFTHQSAKDFLTEREPQAVFPSGKEAKHQSVFLKSIKAMSQVLKQDIYNLAHLGTSIENIEHQYPSPNPLAPVQYASVYWIDHFLKTQNAFDNITMIDAFLRQYFLYWFEALSLLQSISSGVLALLKLVTSLQDVLSCKIYTRD